MIKYFFRDFLGNRVIIKTDKDNPEQITYHMRDNFLTRLESSLKTSGGRISITASAILYLESNENIYFLRLKAQCNTRLIVKFENSFSILIDDKLYHLNIEPNITLIREYVNSGEHTYLEAYGSVVEKDFIKLISNSKNVKIVINGMVQEITGYLSKKNIERFRKFYYNYLEVNK